MLDSEKLKINCAFGEAVYDKYQQIRYGISSCKIPKEKVDILADLQYLIEYISNDYNTENPSLLNHKCCDIKFLIEKVNTL